MRIRSSDDENEDIMNPSGLLDDPDFFNDSPEYDMSLFKKSVDKATVDKPVKESKAKAPKAAVDKPKGQFGPRVVPDGFVGLEALAVELGIKPSVARRKLRTAEGVTKPEGQHGWYWKDGSRELTNIRKILTVKE